MYAGILIQIHGVISSQNCYILWKRNKIKSEKVKSSKKGTVMAKAVKLADIAEQLGVSTVTVSKALSGQKGVSEAMREKIKQLADELGYKQHLP